MNAHVSSAVGANVILVRPELAALSSDTLELLLSGSVGIANLDLLALALLSQVDAMVFTDDIFALVARVEPFGEKLAR